MMSEVTAQAFAYEIRKNGAAVLRCFSQDGIVEIPETIGGFPVSALGAYAFSAHLDEQTFAEGVRDGRIRIYVPPLLSDRSLPPPLCGNALEELIIPAGVRQVGRYCFYNCAKLRALTFWGQLRDWGSGVFTGCHGIRELTVNTLPDGTSGLKEVLDELREELCVTYECGNGRARLVFPEFYEEGVENTPARILEDHVHGSGILYRNCFASRKFDFAQYDSLFAYAQANESESLAIRMAFCRLRYPQGLSDRARARYSQYLAEHLGDCGIELMERRDMEGLRWLVQFLGRYEKPVGSLDILSVYAARKGFAEAQSLLMDFAHSAAPAGKPKGRQRLEL